MKIVVTGASGYIGRHVVKQLCDWGLEVIAIDVVNKNIDTRASFIEMNIFETDQKDVYELMKKPDIVLHLAWLDGFNHYAESHLNNLVKHFNFIKGIIDSGCKSVTVMGTVHEVGYCEGKVKENTPCFPLSYYGVAKNSLRQLLYIYTKDKSVSLKWLRAYYILGDDRNNHSIFTKIIEKVEQGEKVFPFTKGTNQFDFITIDELAKQIAASSIQDNVDGIINVCSGEPRAIKDVVEDFIKRNNFDIRLDYGRFPQRQYDSPVVYGDNSKIQQILKNMELLNG